MALERIDELDLLRACEIGESQDAVTFCAGSHVFRQGDRGDCAYLIESGEVRIVREQGDEVREIARLGVGELLGEMAPIDDMRRSASAIAASDIRLAPIPRQTIEALVDAADPMLRLLVRLLLQRLRGQVSANDPEPGEGAEASVSAAPEVVAALESVREQALGRVRMRRAIGDAITRRELLLHFQPVVDLASGRACGFEALTRWAHPRHGLIPPGRFIPVAEETDLIHPMGRWCLRSACEFVVALGSALPDSVTRGFFVAVNVSPPQIRTLDQVERLLGIVRDSGVDASRIKIEVTERLLVDNPDVATRGLARFKDAGMTVAIDDFGTGYSSLSYLHRFPLDTLKLDRSFVDRLSESDQRRAVVEAIVRLAGTLHMDVVAEGIERAEDLLVLEAFGVSMAQGFLLGRPMSAEKLRGWSMDAGWRDAGQAGDPRLARNVA